MTLNIDLGPSRWVPIDIDLGPKRLIPATVFGIQDHQTTVAFVCRTASFALNEKLVLLGQRLSPFGADTLQTETPETVTWRLKECKESYAWFGTFPEVCKVSKKDISCSSEELMEVQTCCEWPWNDLFRDEADGASG